MQQAEETGRIFLMIAIGFFTGMFVATLDVTASTLFLNRFDEQKYLPRAILASGLLGMVITYVFARYQSKIRFTNLTYGFIILVLCTLTAVRLGLGQYADNKWLIFSAFISIGPFNALILLIFWGVFGRLFSLRESKRIISRIDSGQLLASVVALFTIPLVLTFLSKTADLLWVTSGSAAVILLLLLYTNKRYGIDRKAVEPQKNSVKPYSFGTLFGNKYVVLMAIFVNISMVCVFFVNYSFLATTAEQFPDSRQLASFISIFSGTIIITSFLLQNFVTDRLINTYGLKITLLINPVLLGIFTVISAVVGTALGYTKESGLFLLFFMTIALSKLFAQALKDSVDSPTFKLYFLSMDSAMRFNVQTRIEGVVTMFAGVLAGSLMWLIESAHIFDRIYFTYFVFPITIGWFWITSKLYQHYRRTLENTLVANQRQSGNNQQNRAIEIALKHGLDSHDPAQVIQSLQLIERIEPGLLEGVLKEALLHPLPEVQTYAAQKMNTLAIDVNLNVGSTQSANVPADTSLLIGSGSRKMKFASFGLSSIQKLARSKQASEREMAVDLVSQVINAENVFILIELMRDADISVQRLAIVAARKARRAETWLVLIELLQSNLFYYTAEAALVEFGDAVLPTLETAFHRSSKNNQLLVKIIQICGRIGSEQAAELLWYKIEYPDVEVATQVLLALNSCQAQATPERTVSVKRLLEIEIGKAAWNQAALLEIAHTPWNDLLKMALEEEMSTNFDRVFILLSLIYDAQSVRLVRENLERGTSEEKVYALELLSVFIDKNLKTILFPLLDDIPAAEEVKIYQMYFPREVLSSVEVLKHIINRDCNQVNRWTKACAMYAFAQIPGGARSNDVIAQLFNRDRLLHETAAWAIYRTDTGLYHQLIIRLPESIRKWSEHAASVDQLLVDESIPEGFIVKRVIVLKQIPVLSRLPGVMLAELADFVQEVPLPRGNTLPLGGSRPPFYIVASGKIWLHRKETTSICINEREWIGEAMTFETVTGESFLEAVADTVLYAIDQEKFYQMATRYPQVAQGFIQILNHRTATQLADELAA